MRQIHWLGSCRVNTTKEMHSKKKYVSHKQKVIFFSFKIKLAISSLMWTAISSLMWLKPVKLPLRFMQSASLWREEQVPWLHRVRKHNRPVPENVFCEVCPLQWLQEHLPGPQADTTALKGYTKPQGRARAGRGRAPGLEVPPVPPPALFVLFCPGFFSPRAAVRFDDKASKRCSVYLATPALGPGRPPRGV